MLIGLIFLPHSQALVFTLGCKRADEEARGVGRPPFGKKRCWGWSSTEPWRGRARQLMAAWDGEALCQNHHQHGACIYRIIIGPGFTEKKAGAARNIAGGMPGACGATVDRKRLLPGTAMYIRKMNTGNNRVLRDPYEGMVGAFKAIRVPARKGGKPTRFTLVQPGLFTICERLQRIFAGFSGQQFFRPRKEPCRSA